MRIGANRHFCGGSILNENWVVSAAHCTVNQHPAAIRVATGSTKISEGELYSLSLVINHEAYNPTKVHNDISLLKTESPMQFSDLVQPIALPSEWTKAKETAVASGWGLLSNPGSTPTDLQFVSLRTITNDDCTLIIER